MKLVSFNKLFKNLKDKSKSNKTRKQNDIQTEINNAYLSIFLSKNGELVLDDLGRFCNVIDISYRKGLTHADMAFQDGVKAAYVYIQTRINEATENEIVK